MSKKVYKYIRKELRGVAKTILFITIITIVSYFITEPIIVTDNVDISSRIQNISHNLEEASSELSNIQKELEGRIEYVENLKKEAEIAENVISLSNEQVNAIQAKLNQELEASSSKSFFQSMAISAFFFVLGYIVHPLSKAIKKWSDKRVKNDISTSYDNKYTDDDIAQAIRLLEAINQSKTSHDD